MQSDVLLSRCALEWRRREYSVVTERGYMYSLVKWKSWRQLQRLSAPPILLTPLLLSMAVVLVWHKMGPLMDRMHWGECLLMSLHSTLGVSTPFHIMCLHSVPHYVSPLRSTLCVSTPFHIMCLHSVPHYVSPLRSTLCVSTPFHIMCLHSVPHWVSTLHSTLYKCLGSIPHYISVSAAFHIMCLQSVPQ